jgi:solute carrier family 13 (sodium-dependent dicarboxylate transporter), member 2/3/5
MRAMAAPAFVLTRSKAAFIVLGLAAAAAILLVDSPLHDFGEHGSRPAVAAAVTALMAIWWLTEALPIYVTACVPLAVYPFLRVYGERWLDNAAGAWAPYVHPYIFLFMGGMAIAAAMQQWGLHRRIALAIMRAIGAQPARLLLGVLAATAFVSLWISNTATATMMVPIGIALVVQLESRMDGRRLVHYGAALMLAIAYASNVGGIGTKIGTAPNAMLSGFLAQRGADLTFLEFMAVGTPFVVLFLPVVWWALWRHGRRDAPPADAGGATIDAEWRRLGPMTRGEWVVLAAFLAAAALWISAQPITRLARARWPDADFGSAHVEAAIAMGTALALMLWRVRGRAALEPRALRTVPWETLLLLGGGFSMAAAIEASGLSDWMAAQLAGVQSLPALAQVLVASLVTVGLSAIASNTATIAVMLSVIAASVAPAHVDTVLFAATIAASCDFALPVGTPPNAIVFGSGYVTIPTMFRIGVLLDVAAAVLAGLWCYAVVPLVL